MRLGKGVDRAPMSTSYESSDVPRVLLIGAGGLGSASALALIGGGAPLDITIIDDDRVEMSNLHRQVLYRDNDVNRGKAMTAARILLEAVRSRALGLTASAIHARVDKTNVVDLVTTHDLVIEGTDNHEAKFLVADACVATGTPLVQAGVVGWSGWVLATRPHESACLRCVFEDIPATPSVATCNGDGVLGAAVGVIGSLQATLAIRLLSGQSGALLRYDAFNGIARASYLEPRADCRACGARK